MMKKISWWQPQIGSEEKKLIIQVLETNFPNEGALTSQFEQKVTDLLQIKYGVGVTSGTAATYLSLKALGIGYGDEVIVPDITFIATANAVEMCGAKPVLVDIEPERMTIDPQAITQAITKNTKAIIPVHVSGRAPNMDAIIEIAEANGLYVVEDAAEAFMSKHNGRYLGTIGEVGCFSFSPAKTITTGQGGMVVTNNEEIFFKLKELKDQGRPRRGTGGDPGVQEDRQVHPGNDHSRPGRNEAVRGSTGIRSPAFVAHFRRTHSKNPREGIPRTVHRASPRTQSSFGYLNSVS